MKLVRFGWLPFPLCCFVWFCLTLSNLDMKSLLEPCWFDFGLLWLVWLLILWLSLNLPQFGFDCFSSHFLCFGYLRKIVCTLCITTNYSFPLLQPQILLSSFHPLSLFSIVSFPFFFPFLNSTLHPSSPCFFFSFSVVILWLYCRIISST